MAAPRPGGTCGAGFAGCGIPGAAAHRLSCDKLAGVIVARAQRHHRPRHNVPNLRNGVDPDTEPRGPRSGAHRTTPMPLGRGRECPFPDTFLLRTWIGAGRRVAGKPASLPHSTRPQMAVASRPETTASSESPVRWVPFSATGTYFVAAQGVTQQWRIGTSHLVKAPSAFSTAAERWESASALSIGAQRLSENRQEWPQALKDPCKPAVGVQAADVPRLGTEAHLAL